MNSFVVLVVVKIGPQVRWVHDEFERRPGGERGYEINTTPRIQQIEARQSPGAESKNDNIPTEPIG
jgi:hypothetical protein